MGATTTTLGGPIVKTRTFDQVREGEEIPTFPLALTLQRLVMESAANRDFAPIHHDREIARAGGAPEPYANTMLVQAMFEATLRQWMGLDGRLRKLAFSMRSFATAGSTLTGHGRITAKRSEAHGGLVELEVWTESGGARAATGTATVWLPTGKQATMLGT
jgi:acyl dehydratase